MRLIRVLPRLQNGGKLLKQNFEYSYSKKVRSNLLVFAINVCFSSLECLKLIRSYQNLSIVIHRSRGPPPMLTTTPAQPPHLCLFQSYAHHVNTFNIMHSISSHCIYKDSRNMIWNTESIVNKSKNPTKIFICGHGCSSKLHVARYNSLLIFVYFITYIYCNMY